MIAHKPSGHLLHQDRTKSTRLVKHQATQNNLRERSINAIQKARTMLLIPITSTGGKHDKAALNLQGQTYNVTSYVAAPEDSVKGVIYNAYAGDSPESVRQGFETRNPGIEVVDARRIGQSKTIQITFFGKKLPSQIIYQCGVCRVHPFREQHEVCFNCRRVGHRTDVCYKPKTLLCRRCAENSPPPAQAEQPTCQPACIVCNGGHNTGSRNCKFRLIKKNQQAASQGNLTPNQGDNDSTLAGHQSRSKLRGQGATGNGGNHSRHSTSSFPPLGRSASKEKRSSSRGRSESRSNKN
ncbi:hypothetical protein HPB47_016920, partial [Ixodes persulcatus]